MIEFVLWEFLKPPRLSNWRVVAGSASRAQDIHIQVVPLHSRGTRVDRTSSGHHRNEGTSVLHALIAGVKRQGDRQRSNCRQMGDVIWFRSSEKQDRCLREPPQGALHGRGICSRHGPPWKDPTPWCAPGRTQADHSWRGPGGLTPSAGMLLRDLSADLGKHGRLDNGFMNWKIERQCTRELTKLRATLYNR